MNQTPSSDPMIGLPAAPRVAHPHRPPGWLWAVALILLWGPIIQLLGAQWSIFEQYHYGWAVPLLCLYLVWERWRNRPPVGMVEVPGTATALLLASACLLFPLRVLQEASPFWRAASYGLGIGAVFITVALIHLHGGSRWSKHFAFPVAFFLVAVPWPSSAEGLVIQNVGRFVTATVSEFVNLIGIPAVRHGNVLEVSTGVVGIDEACSGVRSIQATFMIGLFFGELYRMTVVRRALVVLLGFSLAIVLNVFRTAFLVITAARDGISAVDKWHDLAGTTVLLACFSGLWGIALLFRPRSNSGGSTGGSPVALGDSPNGAAQSGRQISVLTSSTSSNPPHEPEGRATLSPARRDEALPMRRRVSDARRGEDTAALPIGNGSGVQSANHGSGKSLPDRGGEGIPETQDPALETRNRELASRIPYLRFASVAAIALSVLSVAGSELWFRLHERRHVNEPQWTVEMPAEKTQFTSLPITENVRGQLQYDTGSSVAWHEADGSRWQMFYFRWNPARSLRDRVRVQLAKSHRPEFCLRGTGRELKQEFPPQTFAVNGVFLPFRIYEFTDRGNPLFVFFSVREDLTRHGAPANMREDAAARLRAAWQGNRGLGQRSLEIAIWGMRDISQAEAAVRRELPRFIRTGG